VSKVCVTKEKAKASPYYELAEKRASELPGDRYEKIVRDGMEEVRRARELLLAAAWLQSQQNGLLIKIVGIFYKFQSSFSPYWDAGCDKILVGIDHLYSASLPLPS
jgi:hypothetical protein